MNARTRRIITLLVLFALIAAPLVNAIITF
jgi:hypothetical protein